MSKKKKLRDLSRQWPTTEEAEAARTSLREAPPIVTAILGASLVEHALEKAIRSKLKRQDDETWGKLIDPMLGKSGQLTKLKRKLKLLELEERSGMSVLAGLTAEPPPGFQGNYLKQILDHQNRAPATSAPEATLFAQPLKPPKRDRSVGK